MVMIDPFGLGRQLGDKVIKPVVNVVAGVFWGVIIPSKDESVSINPPDSRLALTPEARINLEEALRMGQKGEFVKRLKFWEKMLDLDPVKVAYTITTCLEAMKSGSSEAVRGACLNLLGSSFFK